MKVLSIVQARTGSNRLSGKIYKKLQNKTILEHIIDFLRFSKKSNEVIIATTTLDEDQKIVDLCKKNGINYYRGSSHDVLDRYYNCAKSFNGDIIVRITSDNPLIDPRYVDHAISLCMESKCDYVSNMINQTFPLGYLIEVLTFSTLEKLHLKQEDPQSREHMTPHIRQNPYLYKVKEFSTPLGLERPNWRLTVDYIEDYQLMEKIFENLYHPDSFIKYESVVDFLEKNKDLIIYNKS